jgi:superfamily I DNA and RNA helicase
MNVIADELKLNKDDLALLLVKKIEELDLSDSLLYYNFPFYRGESKDDLIQAHLLFVSRDYGVIFFRCVASVDSFTEIEKAKLDDLDSHIFSKINKHESLRLGRRELKINVTPAIFINSTSEFHDDTFIGVNDVKKIIQNNKKEILSGEEFELLIATIEGTFNLKHKKDRDIGAGEKLTKGNVLTILQNKEAVFDIEQKRAALNIIDSPQRIRGLAGSGKTIILAMKVALYHLQNPEAEILYTYFTKALYGQVKYLIEKYYRDFSENREPDWKKIHILHGWGGKGLRGVYSDTCFENSIPSVNFFEAKKNRPKDPFSYVCEQLDKNELKAKFDLTLIDEGQDFPKHFYRVCRKITKDDRIVWAYDDFQNIFDVDIQNEKDTFGKNSKGEFYIDFSREKNKLQDIILYKCYRNPRYALLNAFALGLGIYNSRVLQRLENNKHWEDLGFFVEQGDSKDNDQMIISRPIENSPIETNDYFNADSVTIKVFTNLSDECRFIVDEINNDIKHNELRPDDICVISLDGNNIAAYFSSIQLGLEKKGINVFNLLEASNNNTFFSRENHVTLSTINKAKGNESGMVYVVGVDAIFFNKDFIIDRNKLFTAITRSKGWVTITGLEAAGLCEEEINKLKDNDYKLKFIQPSKSLTKTILRGMTEQQGFLNEVNKKIETFAKVSGLSPEEIIKILAKQTKEKK